MSLSDFIAGLQIFFLLYFIGINTGYLALSVLSFPSLKRYLDAHSMDDLPRGQSGFEPPVSIVVPAYNEEATIAASVRSILQLEYLEYEVIVVNDGAKDDTLNVLKREFELFRFPEAYWRRIDSKPIRAIYRSHLHPNLRVIDKENGGKADALNAGINAARYPFFCGVDADSILQRDSLRRVVEPFLEDPLTIATGGTVRVANGCIVNDGFLEKVGLPTNSLALLQIVEYLRAFLFGRLGWTSMNAVLIISGAFGVFRKESVVAVGGYRHDTVGEDMELVMRLHRWHRTEGIPYRIHFVPDPICWTEAPESLGVLKNQRVRWQQGLCESLIMNAELLCHPKGGAAGWIAYPFMMIFEGIGPLIEVAGYIFMICGFLLGVVSRDAFIVFLLVAIAFGMVLSVSALLLEELSFHIYSRPRHLLTLFAIVILENFGYRQLNSVWRLWGLMRWVTGKKGKWGTMTRTASWQRSNLE